MIIGDSGGGNRPILTIGTHLGEPAPLTMALQIDGGAHTLTVNGKLLGTEKA